MDNETMSLLLNAVATIIGILLTMYVIPWLKNKVGEQKLSEIKAYAEIGVRAAEKLFTVEEFADKKEYVVNLVTAKSNEIGIVLSADDINALIESIVQYVKEDK